MKCMRCQNQDEKYFYFDGEVYYCRKCIQFGRINVGESVPVKKYQCKRHRCSYELVFDLTPAQLKASRQILSYIKEGENVLVYAACGAGKTELTMEPIKNFLNQGKKVGFAIARRQVVLEIAQRMQQAFKTIKVVPVCSGYTEVVDGDLIVCTMHQLYRYHQTFDLLICDEVDAFPFKNNELLEVIAQNSCKGQILYLSATPDEKMLKDVEAGKLKMVELFTRPHGFPLVLPTVYKLPLFLQMIHLTYFLSRHTGQVLIFVPTIAMAQNCTKIYSLFFNCAALTSKTIEKDAVLAKVKNKEIQFLFCTTVLERGITIQGVDIAILESDHGVFDEASLIQIIGRVGRSKTCPGGTGIFYCKSKTNAIKRCEQALRKMNESLM